MSTVGVETLMTIKNRLVRWGGARLSKRVARTLPLVGAAVAVATAVATIRRKGVVSGTLDTGLNAMPLIGTAKNVIEIARGRDFFPDRYGSGVVRPDPSPVR